MQYYVYNKMKQLSTEENSNNEMIQMEFGENFTCLYQDEVARAHWQTNGVTLHFNDMVLERQKEFLW